MVKEKLVYETTSVANVSKVIEEIVEEARKVAYQAVNFAMVKAYWNIGREIFEEEQRGKARADYGKYLIKELSNKLTANLGKGFDISNLKNMRQFYMVFPNSDALRRQLSLDSLPTTSYHLSSGAHARGAPRGTHTVPRLPLAPLFKMQIMLG